jgi:hypothetical protein
MKEQNELLEAALKLLNILNNVDDLSYDEWEVIVDAQNIVAQHRTEPKRIEGWINLYAPDEGYYCFIYPTEEDAKTHCSDYTLRQVHIREVVPVEWEPWTGKTVQSLAISWEELAAAHNAEMERVTK